FVDESALVAGEEPDRGTEEEGHASPEEPDEEGGTHPVDELRPDVLAERGGAQPVLATGFLALWADVLVGPVIDEERADDSQQQEGHHDPQADDQLGVTAGEVQGVGALASTDGFGDCACFDARRPWDVAHEEPPVIWTRVRGSIRT